MDPDKLRGGLELQRHAWLPFETVPQLGTFVPDLGTQRSLMAPFFRGFY